MAQHCAAKLLEEGAVVLGMSDSRGYVYEPGGLTREQLDQVGYSGRAPARCDEAPRGSLQLAAAGGGRAWRHHTLSRAEPLSKQPPDRLPA